MTAASSITADIRHAIELLADLDDPAATRTAAALSRWLAGEAFESAAGLVPGWRSHVQLTARSVALEALTALHPGLEDLALARLIVTGVQEATTGGRRPDGERGHFHDLAKVDVQLSERSWRRIIAAARGQREHRLATQAMKVWLRKTEA